MKRRRFPPGHKPIRLSSEVSSPCVAGFIRKAILLPQGLEAVGEEKLRGVIAHEQSHLKSRDLEWTGLIQFLQSLFWFHPLVWWMDRVYIDATEEIADGDGVQKSGNRELYLSLLAEMALRKPNTNALSLPMTGRTSLGRRLSKLGMGTTYQSVGTLTRALWAVSAGLLLLVLATPVQAIENATIAWGQSYGNARNNNYRELTNKVRVPKKLWEVPGTFGTPVVAGDYAYVPGPSLTLVNWRTGKVIARATSDVPSQRGNGYGASPVLTPSGVVVAQESQLISYSRDLTVTLWNTSLPGMANSTFRGMVTENGKIIVATGSLMCLDSATGKILWSATDASAQMTPAVTENGVVIVGYPSGELKGFNLEDGSELWSQKYEENFSWTNPVVDGDRFFLGDRGNPNSRGGQFGAYSVADGSRIWHRPFGAMGFATPGSTPDYLILGFGRRTVFASKETGEYSTTFDVTTGQNPFGSPTLIGDAVTFGNLDGNLYCFDLASKTMNWRFDTRVEEGSESQVYGFVYLEAGVYLVSTTRGLIALGNDDTKAPATGTVLRDTPDKLSVISVVSAITGNSSGESTYDILQENGKKLQLVSDSPSISHWMMESWTKELKVEAEYITTPAANGTQNKVESVKLMK